ncbi:hypothetical protein Ancab_024389, partial [Ancistrocladus abbreviatus]
PLFGNCSAKVPRSKSSKSKVKASATNGASPSRLPMSPPQPFTLPHNVEWFHTHKESAWWSSVHYQMV